MPNFSRRAERRLLDQLGPDEHFVFAAVAQPGGSSSRYFVDAAAGNLSAAERRTRSAARRDSDQIAGRIPTKNGYLSVTTRRLIWLGQGRTGFPSDEIVATFEAEEVLDASSNRSGGKDEVVVRFADGTAADVWVHRSNKPDLLVDAIKQLARGSGVRNS